MSGKGQHLAIYSGILLVLIAGWLAFRRHQNREPDLVSLPQASLNADSHIYDSFAQCLAAKHAKMYGLFWCPHCADQKAEFGASFHYVPYVECTTHESPHELTPECKAAGVSLFPSWQFGDDPPKEGVLTLQQLGQKTGCSLP